MLNSKRVVLILLALVLTSLAVASSFVPAAYACLPIGVYRYYYSASYTVQVGTKSVRCPCIITTTGTVTSYVKYTASSCIEP